MGAAWPATEIGCHHLRLRSHTEQVHRRFRAANRFPFRNKCAIVPQLDAQPRARARPDWGILVQMSIAQCEPAWSNVLDRIEAARAALPARPDAALHELSVARSMLVSRLGHPPAGADTTTGEVVRLTVRERQVLILLAQGNRNKEIALSLRLRERTVKFHVANLLQKLGAQSRTEALHNAIELGLLDTGRGSID